MRRIIFYLLLSIVAFACFVVLHSFFQIKTISLSGADTLDGISPYYRRFIFTINPQDIEKNIIRNNPYVESARVIIHFPDQISIDVTTIKPVATLKMSDGYIHLSSKGRILSKQRDTKEGDYIWITHFEPYYYQNFIVGDFIDIKEVADSLEFIRESYKLSLQVSKVDIQNENMIVLMSKEGEIRISSTKNIKEQVAQLASVLEQIRIQSRKFSRIDVRFDKPVIAFK